MKFRKSDAIITVCVMLICINNIVLAKSKIKNEKYDMSLEIAQPVIEIIKDEPIKREVYQNSFPIEYNFCVNNYNDNSINEVEFDYIIEIENSDADFPVGYKLIEIDTNREILLRDGKSEFFKLDANQKQSRKFKLVLDWKEKGEVWSEKSHINLKVKAVQSKEGYQNEDL